MPCNTSCLSNFLYCVGAAASLFAQAKPGPDVLILIDGEKLIGELKGVAGSKVSFKSDLAGLVTVDWSKIQELRTANKFAVVPKDAVVRKSLADQVAQGPVELSKDKIQVATSAPGGTRIFDAANVGNVVDEAAFTRALQRQSFLEGWKGNSSFGLSLTKATLNTTSISLGGEISRSDPSENWMRLRNKTTFNVNVAYAKISAVGFPGSKTNLFNFGAVHDYYFKPRVFAFAGASWEHNSTQGLQLLQTYGGGIGFVLLKNDKSEWNARAGIGFMEQRFIDSSLNQRLIGSRFGQTYTRTFGHGVVFYEQADVRPAWNHMQAFFGGGMASLTVPIYRRIGISLGTFDSFINNPPPGFKKNTFQVTVSANIAIR